MWVGQRGDDELYAGERVEGGGHLAPPQSRLRGVRWRTRWRFCSGMSPVAASAGTVCLRTPAAQDGSDAIESAGRALECSIGGRAKYPPQKGEGGSREHPRGTVERLVVPRH